MPDILIRMEMPERCDAKCPLYNTGLGYFDCVVTKQYYNWGLPGRPSDCPLVELPPHGDLISRDDLLHTTRCHLALYDSCPEDLSLADKSRRDEIQNAIADIFNAPVVVPAERREGDG